MTYGKIRRRIKEIGTCRNWNSSVCSGEICRYSGYSCKKGEETVEQGKVLNKELKHNVKSTIKDYKASNGKMHTVHEAEVVEAEVVEDDDIPGSATEVEDVDDHEKTETEEAETDSKMETVEETETEEE